MSQVISCASLCLYVYKYVYIYIYIYVCHYASEWVCVRVFLHTDVCRCQAGLAAPLKPGDGGHPSGEGPPSLSQVQQAAEGRKPRG